MPILEPFAKNSTRAMVPSVSAASALMVTDAGAANDAPFAGAVSETVGAAFVSPPPPAGPPPADPPCSG